MLPRSPFLEFPPEKRHKVLNVLASYGRIVPLSPKQVSLLSECNINTVRRYLNGMLLKNRFVRRRNGLYQITEEGLRQISYSIRIEERVNILQNLMKRIETELIQTLKKREMIDHIWVQALENRISEYPSVIQECIEKCKEQSSNWYEFNGLFLQCVEPISDSDSGTIHLVTVYLLDKAQKRIPFDVWKKVS